MKKLIVSVFLMAGISSYAQDVTNVSKMETRKAESAEVEPRIANEIANDDQFIGVYKWLMDTPLPEAEGRRQMVNAALSHYIEEDLNLEMDLDVKILKFAESSPELLTVFIGGYATHMIRNDNASTLDANVAGVKKVIDYYEANEQYLDSNNKVEKLMRKEDKEKLRKYVERKT